MKVSLILACAGVGARAGFNKNKLLVQKDGKTVLEQTLSAFYDSGLIDQIIIATSKTDFEFVKNLVLDKAKVVLGGDTRTQSVKNALVKVDGIVKICIKQIAEGLIGFQRQFFQNGVVLDAQSY